ncbi:MAG TPA: PepSY-like domain-containing protein [Chitinophagaceae bacterium]|nr:PepSY-like domain-containing protein [Chitinophagaceae bacterium]
MKRIVAGALLLFPLLISLRSHSQIREIPKAVRETFANQYPKAEQADFRDQLVRVDVSFELNGQKMLASYTNKGDWKGTEQEYDFDSLAAPVKDGFDKCKYGDWDKEETKILYQPGGGVQYRIKVKKSDLQKKYLYFNGKGRLLRESVTL